MRALLASEDRLRELVPDVTGVEVPVFRPLPGDLAALRERLSRGRDLIHGRDLLSTPTPPEDLFPTAIPAVDAVLGGGLARGMLTELRGAPSSGRLSLVLSLLAAATSRGESAALVDLGDHLDPQAAVAAGVDLSRLLWARPMRLRDALAAAEIALGGAFPLVVLELGGAPVRRGAGSNGSGKPGDTGSRRGTGNRGGDEHAWLRLARAARHHRGALLVSTPYRVTGSAAAEVLVLSQRRGVWLGSGNAPRLLLGVDSRLQREKSRRQPGLANAGVAWRAAEAVQSELPWGPRAAPTPPEVPPMQPAASPTQPAAASVQPKTRRQDPPAPKAQPRRQDRLSKPGGEAQRSISVAPRAPRRGSRSEPLLPARRPSVAPAGPPDAAAAATTRAARQARPAGTLRPNRVPSWVPLARAALAESLGGAPPRGRA